MIDKYIEDMTEEEIKLIEMFISKGERTDSEIKQFIEILVALRERPGKNPQLKNKR
jgi:hypothetical protein